jgi:hypothetical protein
MNSRQRISIALNHKEPDKIPVDFGGTFVSGMNASIVYFIRQKLGLDPPGTQIKEHETNKESVYKIFDKYNII